MRTQVVIILAACAVAANAQPAPNPSHKPDQKQPAGGTVSAPDRPTAARGEGKLLYVIHQTGQ